MDEENEECMHFGLSIPKHITNTGNSWPETRNQKVNVERLNIFVH
jgi:hypothetical protein